MNQRPRSELLARESCVSDFPDVVMETVGYSLWEACNNNNLQEVQKLLGSGVVVTPKVINYVYFNHFFFF